MRELLSDPRVLRPAIAIAALIAALVCALTGQLIKTILLAAIFILLTRARPEEH